MRFGTDLFESAYSLLERFGEYEDELEMDRPFFTFFDLAYYIRSFMFRMPGFEVVSRDC